MSLDPFHDKTPERPPRRRRRHAPAALLAALAVALLVACLPFTRFAESVERRTQDFRFHLRGPIAARSRIVIVALDEKTELAWGRTPMIFWTGHYADLIRQAQAGGALAIGFDVIPAVSGQRYLEAQAGRALDGPDTRLAEAIQSADDRAPGFVVLAEQIFANDARGAYLRPQPVAPAGFFLQIPEVVDNLGFADFPESPDGVVRECLRSARAGDGGSPIPSFATLIASHARGVQDAQETPNPASRAGDDPLPSFYVDDTLTAFPHVSAVDLADEPRAAAVDSGLLRGAVVLVGSTAADGGDFHIGPDSRFASGVALQAQAVATILDGRELRRGSRLAEASITLLLGLAATALTSACALGGGGKRAASGLDAAALAVATVLWSGTAYLLFARHHFLLPVVAPLLALTLPCLTFRAVHLATEWLRRTRVETEFGHYASPEIRDYLLQYPDLEPENREVSVLFLDIRGSTAYAELRRPADVMVELNAMFRAIDGVLQRHHGLLYRYTGDGFLAVFGAPKPSVTHAADALRCAIELLRETERFNRLRAATGLETWSVGCSVNSGIAAAGKFGTAERLEYTVIGDVVNLAAKIESKNKDENGVIFSDLVVTEATLTRAPGVDQTGALRPVRLAVDIAIGGRQNTARLNFYRLAAPARADDDDGALRPEETGAASVGA